MLVSSKMSASFLLFLLFGISLASHHCQRTIKNKGSRVKLGLTCQTGKLTWLNPEGERAISFSNKRRSFTVCLDSAHAGAASVYRLEGSAKTLLKPDSESAGRIGCLQSDCTHVTLLLQPSSSDTLEYNYTTNITNICPKCTSDCQRKCFCNSQYVFVAEVLESRPLKHYYQNYVKIRYFLRYHGNFTHLLGRTLPRCENGTSSTVVNATDEQMKLIPQYGTLKVKSKCNLQTGKTYLFSASLQHKRHNSKKPSLTMCCAQENYKHAWKFYSYLLNNRQCC